VATQERKNFRGYNQNTHKSNAAVQQNKVYKPISPNTQNGVEQQKSQEWQIGQLTQCSQTPKWFSQSQRASHSWVHHHIYKLEKGEHFDFLGQ